MMAVPDVLPKGEFAALVGVSPGRISQYISEGKISAAALAGSGRSARINVPVALRELNRTLDPAQRLGGNALHSRAGKLRIEAPSAGGLALQAPAPAFRTDDVADAIAAEKLEQERMRTRRMRVEEAAANGRYVDAAEARAATAKAAALTLTAIEGSFADLADSLAGRFAIPASDAQHAIEQWFREARAKASASMRAAEKAVAALIPAGADDA